MKFLVFFDLKPETVAAAMQRPSDRAAVVGKLCEAVGGRLESYYWMFGEHDGFVIADLPDSAAAAAVSLAVTGSGAFSRLETHELIPADRIQGVLDRARTGQAAYAPPGA
ncbi:GYD domain-containing protein [Amnibacterium sp. CER49]|uniref:GYD domain-containing protein n=1 Tax=Amnibacterium sp. CER49 TaxID=3039161 RepID=UPI002449726F|nr:GYD domain-containing protein [Amnibacterium sp. CER49]MDH2443235.1 GYD domain-containing protein [Amnibacterium sp. CER49]